MPTDQYVDVDFRRDAPSGMSLGCMYETDRMMAAATPDVPRFGDNKLIPESEWDELAEEMEEEIRSGVRDMKNQGNEGSCVGNATVACMQYRMYMAMGQENFRKLSAMSIYKAIGSGPNSGAYVSSGVERSRDVGALPEPGQGYEHEHPPRGYRTPYQSGYRETAKLFRADWERADSRQAIFSAAFQTKPTIIGRRGHSIAYFLPKKVNGVWRIGYMNSWINWGDPINEIVRHGLGWDTWGNMARSGFICENVTIRSEVELP